MGEGERMEEVGEVGNWRHEELEDKSWMRKKKINLGGGGIRKRKKLMYR